MTWKDIYEYSKTLVEKLSYRDWKRLEWVMCFAFEIKKKKREREIKLSPEDVAKAIGLHLGQSLD